MQTDYTGSPAIITLIEQTGLTKFVISRIGNNKNSIPIYEFTDRSSVDSCIAAFEKWSQIADNSLPYSMRLFNTKEDCEFTGEKDVKAKGKVICFTFCLNKEQNYSSVQNQNQNVDVAQAIELALLKMQTKNNESLLLQKLTDMENKIAELESDDDDDIDDAALSGLNNPAIVNLLGMLGKALGGNKSAAPTTINGLNDVKIANINRAVKILAKYDDEIDTDLLKLSSIAETQPATFKMLIASLRTM